MKVRAVVVNWNGGDGNLACLGSLLKAGMQASDIHFVDNGSVDGSVAKCADAFPGIVVDVTGENLGFAAAANRGIRAALQAGADAVWLMNNDATVEIGCLSALTEAVIHAPKCGLYGPRIYANQSADKLWCCGVTLGSGPNLGTLRGHGQAGRGRYETDENVAALTGCGLLILRSVFERVGVLDEAFFVYVEDAEFCSRARKAGFVPRYIAKAVMEHAGAGSTGGGYGRARKYLTAHGTVLYLKRHGTLRQWLCWALLDVLAWPLVFVLALLRGRTGGAWGKLCGTLCALRGQAVNRRILGKRS